jgi:hypothetical protein
MNIKYLVFKIILINIMMMMNYMGAIGMASTTYNILTKANCLSGMIAELIHKGELSHMD